jgi:hypothetical protein
MKCIYCGRFVSYADLNAERAFNKMVTPDSLFGPEEWECYHVACREKERAKYAGKA